MHGPRIRLIRTCTRTPVQAPGTKYHTWCIPAGYDQYQLTLLCKKYTLGYLTKGNSRLLSCKSCLRGGVPEGARGANHVSRPLPRNSESFQMMPGFRHSALFVSPPALPHPPTLALTLHPSLLPSRSLPAIPSFPPLHSLPPFSPSLPAHIIPRRG